jgi:regulator of protease activity HflC (stomatin/prohibitin superfamily)
MDALKDGDKENISSADRLLKKAVKDAMKAGRTAEAVVEYATQARSAADKAKYAERRATDPDSDYDLEKAVKEAEKMARVADKAARKAEAIAATLKEKWLIPAMPGGEQLEPEEK